MEQFKTPKEMLEPLSYQEGEFKVVQLVDAIRLFNEHTQQYKDACLQFIDEINRLRDALSEISEGKGRYNEDRLIHASNTIEDMIEIAKTALAESPENERKCKWQKVEWADGFIPECISERLINIMSASQTESFIYCPHCRLKIERI
ncbi:MAG: hypothetical protein WC238_06160 [Parcubacteria group bacterium]|jgi:hypothetical protein